MSTMNCHCQARIPTTSYTIPGTSLIVWQTTECGNPTSRKATIDDGDSHQYLCNKCIPRFVSKEKSGDQNKWLGWFDGDIPKEAHIYDSYWFWWSVFAAWQESDPKNKKIKVSKKILSDWIKPVAFPSLEDVLANEIEKKCNI